MRFISSLPQRSGEESANRPKSRLSSGTYWHPRKSARSRPREKEPSHVGSYSKERDSCPRTNLQRSRPNVFHFRDRRQFSHVVFSSFLKLLGRPHEAPVDIVCAVKHYVFHLPGNIIPTEPAHISYFQKTYTLMQNHIHISKIRIDRKSQVLTSGRLFS